MAKIVIDCRMWGESGVGRYIRNLVSNLQELDRKNEYYLLLLKKDYDLETDEILKRLPRRFAPRNDNGSNFHKVLADFRWYGVTEQIRLPRILKQIKPDLVHFPHFNVPILYRGKFIVTIHDLIHQHFQMRRATTHDPITYRIKSFGYKTVFQSALRRSTKVLVPSEYVKNLLVSEWKIWDKKIIVTPEGVDEKLLSLNQESRIKNQEVFKKFNIKKPYILYVGNAHPHKNVEGLIKAFLKIKNDSHPELDSGSRTNWIPGQARNDKGDLQLVLAGNEHYFWERIKAKYDKDVKDIIFTGFVSDEELVVLYKNAKAFVQPSFEEGFGIPMLEAMSLGCPVVSSNAGSLPEVGGNAAVYFDPTNLDDMVEKIREVLNNQKLAAELIKKGSLRVKDFSWKKLAEQTLKTFEEVL